MARQPQIWKEKKQSSIVIKNLRSAFKFIKNTDHSFKFKKTSTNFKHSNIEHVFNTIADENDIFIEEFHLHNIVTKKLSLFTKLFPINGQNGTQLKSILEALIKTCDLQSDLAFSTLFQTT